MHTNTSQHSLISICDIQINICHVSGFASNLGIPIIIKAYQNIIPVYKQLVRINRSVTPVKVVEVSKVMCGGRDMDTSSSVQQHGWTTEGGDDYSGLPQMTSGDPNCTDKGYTRNVGLNEIDCRKVSLFV